MEIITPCGDLNDGVVKTTQNAILDRLWGDNLVQNGHTFDLNVKQVYRSIEVQEKYQLSKPHHLYVLAWKH